MGREKDASLNYPGFSQIKFQLYEFTFNLPVAINKTKILANDGGIIVTGGDIDLLL
jgi:hypothetical protein